MTDLPGSSAHQETSTSDSGNLRAQTITGDDGVSRCAWSGRDLEYRRYHDEEWGIELRGDQPLFEKLSLEGFQAGLSWITILRRRPAFRASFHSFDIDAVASLTPDDTLELLSNTGIIRNRLKIEATISNARIVQQLIADSPGALDELLWSFAPEAPAMPQPPAAIPTITAESTAMSIALRARGLRFVGPTTLYALMQSTGMVNDHALRCWRHEAAAESLRRRHNQ